jgi:nucleoside-diphosphate kinase
MKPNFVERTLVILKPDAVARGLVGEIVGRFERAGLTVIGLKMVKPTIEFARAHYPMTDVQLIQMGQKTLSTYAELGLDPVEEFGTGDPIRIGKMIHEWNAEFLSSGPVVVMALKGFHAVRKVRSLCGKTMPIAADPGTIRGDFSSASPAVANTQKSAVFNLMHASDNENDPAEPENEIRYWFKPEELIEWAQLDVAALSKTPYSVSG